MDKMLIHQVLTFLLQINYVWSSYLDKFWMTNTNMLYYHKEKMDDSDYEEIMSLHHQLNNFKFNYWNGLNLTKTGNSLIVLEDIEPDYMKNLLKQDGIQKSLHINVWIIRSTKKKSYTIQEYFSQTEVRLGLNANIFFVTSHLGIYNVTQILGTGTFLVKYKQHGILDNLDIYSIIKGTKERVDFGGTKFIANYGNFAPYCFVDHNGTITGILPDALRIAAHFMNLSLTFQKPKKENVGIWHKK